MRVFIPRFLGAIAYLVVLTVVGTIAYVAIEGWAWQEALYMTVITVTSVGYAEVRPLSEPGRNFTMILLAGGVTGIGIWFALITSFIVEFDLEARPGLISPCLRVGRWTSTETAFPEGAYL